MDMLVISAHPDDAEIGMGGTIAKLAASGALVTSIVLTDGRRSPNPNKIPIDVLIQKRMTEAKSAAHLLGISETIFLQLPDLKSAENRRRALKGLQAQINRRAPSEIFTLHPDLDRHETHRICGELTREAVKGAISLWAYEVWGLFARWDRFEDITSYLKTKLVAIRAHESQTMTIPYDEGVRGLNRWRAVFAEPSEQAAPCEFAEVFLKL